MSRANRRHGKAAQERALSAVPAPVAQLPIRPITGRQSPKPSLWTWVPSNTYSELAFPQLQGIMRAAEQGMVEQWADLTCRMRASDDHLYSVIETRVNGVAGADWKLSPGQGDEVLAQRAADDCERMLRGIPNLQRAFRDILDGVAVGWSVLEIIWEPKGDEWVPTELIWLHPRRFRFAQDFSMYLWDDGRAAAEAARTGAPLAEVQGSSGIALSPNKYIVHTPRSLQNYPQSSGLLMSCVRPWFVKQWVTKFWLSGAEIAGNPRYIATAPQATDDSVFEALVDQLGMLASDGVMAVREGVTVNVQSPLAQGSGSVWQALYDNANAAMSKAVLGSTLNVEIGDTGGAYSAAESQGDITITPRIMADAAAMWGTLQRDLLRPYLFFNRHKYGGVVPPLPNGETILFEPKIEVDDLLVRTGSVTKNELRQSRGLDPLPQGGDELIPAETAAPAQQPFGFSQRAPASEEAPAALPLRQAPWEVALRIATSTTSR